MHIDARTLEEGSLIEGDLCIVGAGAAGISLAMEWVGSRHRVLLLEGGGFEVEWPMQQLYQGDSVGAPYQAPLEAARLHYFGGTTGHWAGWCAPLEPIDMKKREWVPYSGWPFDRAHLDPFYARAHRYVELGPYEYDAAYYEALDPARKRLPLDESVVWTKLWQFSPPTRFGTAYRDDIVGSSNVHLYTYANVVEILANESVRYIEGLRVKTIDGKEHRVRASGYVLCCGSIQNARLLLASRSRTPAGLGNDYDLVGRFFMEHFEMSGAQLMLEEPNAMSLYSGPFGGHRLPSGELSLTEAVQRRRRILNGTASLRPGTYGENLTSAFQRFARRRRPWERQEDGAGQAAASVSSPSSQESVPPRAYQLHSRAEQSPNPDSRVELSDEQDALGMPRANLNWQLSALDKRSIRVFYDVLARELGRLRLGRLQILDWLLEENDTIWPSFLGGGFHHMGTTRMHDDPQQGVLDADGRVHGIENLYVAGASMFPTAGAPNPTLTLIALALRLSDHLKQKMP